MRFFLENFVIFFRFWDFLPKDFNIFYQKILRFFPKTFWDFLPKSFDILFKKFWIWKLIEYMAKIFSLETYWIYGKKF